VSEPPVGVAQLWIVRRMNPQLRASLVLLLALAHSACMVARSPGVTGRVTDARTGRPVAGAHVGFAEFSAPTASTDSQGQFHLPVQRSFSPLPMFTFEFVRVTLQVSYPGYRPSGTEIDRAVEDFRCHIQLQPTR
jgi:hypothetical protein